MDAPTGEVDVLLLGFGRALQAAGVGVTADRAQTFVRAVDELGADPASVYWAGRRVCHRSLAQNATSRSTSSSET